MYEHDAEKPRPSLYTKYYHVICHSVYIYCVTTMSHYVLYYLLCLCVYQNMIIKLCLSESPNALGRCRIHCSF